VLDETEPSETRLTKEGSDSEWVVSTKLMMMMVVVVMMVILQVEVFNVLFTVSGGAGHERKYFVHCMDCALNISPTLSKVIVLQQYEMSDLVDVYSSLKT